MPAACSGYLAGRIYGQQQQEEGVGKMRLVCLRPVRLGPQVICV